MALPESVETRKNGLILRFNESIDPSSLKSKKAFAAQWNYLHSEAYGSPEYSVRNPGLTGHDPVKIRSLHALKDGKSVFVEIPQLHPVMQFHLHLDLKAQDGCAFATDLYYSIFHQGKEFTDFPGYRKIAKRNWNDFPRAMKVRWTRGYLPKKPNPRSSGTSRSWRQSNGLNWRPSQACSMPKGNYG